METLEKLATSHDFEWDESQDDFMQARRERELEENTPRCECYQRACVCEIDGAKESALRDIY